MGNKIDFFTRSDINSSLKRIEELLSCGIFHPHNSNHVLMRAAFIEILISLRDLMYKSEKYASRISFTDDIVIESKIRDVSDLIKYVRDALCHPDSDNHYIEKNNIKSTFNVAFGKCSLIKIGDFEQKSEYDDDICFFFGSKNIYLNRHIVRAYNEAKEKFKPILNDN
ncbi:MULTISPECIES: hypothetical protein [Psychrilyobacter]|uniref:Uncharacterized protein n=1 Tax=Psychrilyobacter piezotolerans TaxID=2293438 RepID=A0ABX9KDS1_9FUSO|nr:MULTISPECIES: hypothetical protein [Psychrilyobacter]MCS5423086.1 hypothetical protein [Psychrilyobacter sp. S5]NDI79150.1 hypothetical protein [Psychrilyobacter piezotolerans]RDE58948.1 hypothetical protein DV867_14635 [Psychrilyobacter sp. S5]REI39504.1 hypothetical protein DYH56_14635 [Psychrilyobacter piezotolerans]